MVGIEYFKGNIYNSFCERQSKAELNFKFYLIYERHFFDTIFH